MAWWDILWDTFVNGLAMTLPLAELGTEIADALYQFIEPLVMILTSLLYFLIYPVISVLAFIQSAISVIINSIIDLLNGIVYIINDLGYILNVFVGTFPSTWITILSMIILLNLGMRVYHYVKGISIFGWSLGGG